MATPPAYDPTTPHSFPRTEADLLDFWDAIDAFGTQNKLHQGQEIFSFYDGPPFATGLPHYGHLLAGTIKDIVTRHAWSRGFDVPRRFGWDCHGVPVESIIDKANGITCKEDVMRMGLDVYNDKCREVVMTHSGAWRDTVRRIGRWIDFDKDYKTLDPTYMESVWAVFAALHRKGVVYRGYRVMPYSTALNTPLSKHEVDSQRRPTQDPAVTIAFRLRSAQFAAQDSTLPTYLLAWTTTPWTLPSNLALCVHPGYTYLLFHDTERNACFVLHEDLLTALYKDPKKAPIKKLATFKGQDMLGWKYEPLFPFFENEFPKAYTVLNDEYVTSDSGTGIVHQAPAFGEDDFRIALETYIDDKSVLPPCPIDHSGKFFGLDGVGQAWNGVYFKDADKLIIKHLKQTGNLIHQAVIVHAYPFCERSGTPIMYRAVPSWFIRVEDIREDMLKANATTLWVPQYVGENRFGNWLKNARDWNVSRNRYWGTPLPLWVSDDYEEVVCIGSVAELEELSGVKGIEDLHRDKIDHITIPSKQGKGTLRRVEEVFDCWFESGSMPYAQYHQPFENEDLWKKSFPADFISEGMDQTRGWFYSLLVLGVLLHGKAPWKNVIVNGMVLAEDGKKMSKKWKNYPDPSVILEKYGADATRLFLVDSPIVRGDDLRFREDGVKEVITRVLLPWHNSFRFLVQHIDLFKQTQNYEFRYNPDYKSTNIMDRWILARCQKIIEVVKEEMAAYRLYTVLREFTELIDELTNWYIRFNRKRCKGEFGIDEAEASFNTIFEALLTLCTTMSCFVPFITEHIYQTLRPFMPPSNLDNRSVHFLPFPTVNESYRDPVIMRQVRRMRAVIELGRVIRQQTKRKGEQVSIKTPLRDMTVFHASQEYLDDVKTLEEYVLESLNVQSIKYSSDETACHVGYVAQADWPVLGKKLRKDIGRVKKALPLLTAQQIKDYERTGSIEVDGIPLTAGDLTVSQTVSPPQGSTWDADTDRDVVVLLDLKLYPELMQQKLCREFTSRIQQLRKHAGLVATDNADIFYEQVETSSQESAAFEEMIRDRSDEISRTTRCAVRKQNELSETHVVIMSEKQDIDGLEINLTLVKR